MFGSGEMTHTKSIESGSPAMVNVVETLKLFSDTVVKLCATSGLARGMTPFGRPSDFAVVLDTQFLNLVVDTVKAGAFPEHWYIDLRPEKEAIPLDRIADFWTSEHGFTQPLCLRFPVSILDVPVHERELALTSYARAACRQLLRGAEMTQLGVPEAFEHLARFLPEFLKDHPNIDRNIFLMMRFNESEQHSKIQNTIALEARKYDLCVLRADDRDYTGDLWDNVCLYAVGCRYGIAVFEEIDQRDFNPNVALELGLMMAMNKRSLLLKDSRMPKLPTDVVGKLYKPFDTYHIEDSIAECVQSWVRDIGASAEQREQSDAS